MFDWQRASLMARLLTGVLPAANRSLTLWGRRAQSLLQPPLRAQALASLSAKRFHAQGAAAYALLAPRLRSEVIALTVALQTISDYLDNLCDRLGIVDEAVFRQLHRALAFWEEGAADDPYQGLPGAEDGGYLAGLTRECRRQSQKLPRWQLVQPRVAELISLYIDLQAYKHLCPPVRLARLRRWHAAQGRAYPHLWWNEFAAACGSTLGVFALIAAAASPHLTAGEARDLHRSYFPTITAVHILLDYLIDQAEDEEHGELNFVSVYADAAVMEHRLGQLVREARLIAGSLPQPTFHQLAVDGLVAVYLSDPKAQALPAAQRLLSAHRGHLRPLVELARGLRRLHLLQAR